VRLYPTFEPCEACQAMGGIVAYPDGQPFDPKAATVVTCRYCQGWGFIPVLETREELPVELL